MMSGRNDNYLGNFRYRIATSLNYVARNAARLGRLDDLELLVVDWGSETPLRHVLPLTREAAAVTRFLEVNTDTCRAETPEGLTLSAPKAVNAAARRAKGQFLSISPADILFAQMPLMGLLELLSGHVPTCFDITEAMLLVGRLRIPWQICEREPSLEEWDRYLQLHTRQIPYSNDFPGLAGGATQLIFHRRLYAALGGIDEQLSFWGWSDIELGLRTAQRHPVVDLLPFGVFAYDMTQRPDVRKEGIQRFNPHTVRLDFTANDANWGLAAYDVPSYPADPQAPAKTTEAAGPSLRKKAQKLLRIFRERLAIPLSAKERRGAYNNPREAGLQILVESVVIANTPQNALILGTRRRGAAVAAAIQDPTLDIVTCDDWMDRQDMPPCNPDDISMSLQQVEFKGLLHFLTGNIADMPHHLQGIPVAQGGFDLMLLYLPLLGENLASGVLDFGKWLAPGGVALLVGQDAARATTLDALIKNQQWAHLLTCDDIEVLLRP